MNPFYAIVETRRFGEVTATYRWVPRVRFFAGRNHAYMRGYTIALWWSPRNPCTEGQLMYTHGIELHWTPPQLYWR